MSSPKIVLTSPATEMSDYRKSPFIAFSASFSKPRIVPRGFLIRALYPPVPRDSEGRAIYAPYGLRKIEAVLLREGFGENEVAVVHPDNLDKFIGPETKVLAVSSMDPLGIAFVSITYSTLIGIGKSMTAYEFKRLSEKWMKYKPGLKVVVGGAGSWQLSKKGVMEKYGVDVVIIGEAEKVAGEVFRKLVEDKPVEKVVYGEPADVDEIPCIRRAAIHGVVEITRGCGRGCQFCSPTMQRRRYMPIERVVKETEVNVLSGQDFILVATDDLFLYGCNSSDFVPNRNKIMKVFRAIASVRGVKYIQPAHSALPPVLLDKKLVKDLAEFLREYSFYKHNGKHIVTTEVGIETGSTRLIEKYMAGKPKPFKPEDWPEVVWEAIAAMNDNDWYPLATIITGLPEEDESDALATLELLDELFSLKLFIVPLFFVPEENCYLRNGPEITFESLIEVQREIFLKSWRYNIREWGATFFAKYVNSGLKALFAKVTLKVVFSALYLTYYRFKDPWRKRAFREITSEVIKVLRTG